MKSCILSSRDLDARREGLKMTMVTPKVTAIEAANMAMLRIQTWARQESVRNVRVVSCTLAGLLDLGARTPERLAKSTRCADHHFALVRKPAVDPHDFGAMHAPLLSVECSSTRLHEGVVKAALVVAPLESFGVDMSKEPVQPLDARTAVKCGTLQRQCVGTVAVRALFSCTLTCLPSLNRRRDRVHMRSDAHVVHTLVLQRRCLL